MRFAVMCDLHLPQNETSVQYDLLSEAIENINDQKPDIVIVAGDITATGEKNAFDVFERQMCGISHITVLGNSDVRNPQFDISEFSTKILNFERNILVLNTPYGKICEEDVDKVKTLQDGDILVMHHSLQAISSDSRALIEDIANSKNLLIIHGHSHKFQNYVMGKSHVIGVRALDPDKSIGAPPCITYFDVKEDNFTYKESVFGIKISEIDGLDENLGVSCFDFCESIKTATKLGIKNIELKKFGTDIEDEQIELIKKWREMGGRTLSIHMPNIYYNNGIITTLDKWNYALDFAKRIGVNAMTVHPPRVSCDVMEQNKDYFYKFYADSFKDFDEDVTIGFENLHMGKTQKPDNTRGFGCVPEEVISLSEGVNSVFGSERTGVILDVGHARNNPPFNQKFTNGMFYAEFGTRIRGYHIHQTVKDEDGLHNHRELVNWFGPLISYSSFFRAWNKGQISKRPFFLELRSIDAIQNSYKAFKNLDVV